MTNKYLKLIPALSSLALLAQIGQAQAVSSGQNGALTDRPQGKVAQKSETKVDKWADQAKKLAEKWKGTLEPGVNANEVMQKNRERVCAEVQNRVGDRWQKYYEARMNRVQNLERGILALQKRVEFFKSKGLDTTKLESDITTLQGLIGDYKTAYTSFLTALEEVKTLPCSNYDGKFLGELKQARDEWTVVRASQEVIRNFYTNQIKLGLQALRVQLVNQSLESKEE